jgi:hypothetical protein
MRSSLALCEVCSGFFGHKQCRKTKLEADGKHKPQYYHDKQKWKELGRRWRF